MINKFLRKLNSYYYSNKVFDTIEILGYKPLYHKNYNIQYYGKTEVIDINPPENYPRELMYVKGEQVIQQPYYFFIDKGYLIKNTPFLFDGYNNIILENHGGRLKYPKGSIPRLLYLKKRPDLVVSDAVILNSRNSRNFYHWFVDSLSKLEALDHIPNGWKKYKIIATSPLKSWQRDSLKYLGILDENIIEAPNKNIEIHNCLVLSPRRNHLRISKENLSWIKKKMLPFADTTVKTMDKIFISRRQNEGRYLINEEEVSHFLAKKGYVKCYLDEYTLAQQIALFSNASKIVGIHGAGFFNMVFAKNPNVVEIFSDQVHPFYYLFTNAVNGKYRYVLGEASLENNAVKNRKPFHLKLDQLLDIG